MTNNCSIHPDDGLKVECWSCLKSKEDAALALAVAVYDPVFNSLLGWKAISKLAKDYLKLVEQKPKEEQ